MHSFSSCVIIGAALLLAGAELLAAEPVRLTHDGRQKYTPLFRDAGREIVFVELVNPTLLQLRRLILANGTTEPIHTDARTSEFEPAWSADGECYAYLRTRGVLSISVIVRNRQGDQLAEILPGEGFCGYRSPSVAPDHSRVAFSYAEKGTQQIYSTQLDGGDRKCLTDSPGVCNWPAYSPDGGSIVFASSRDGNFEIYRMNVDGSNTSRLTKSPSQDIRPHFSPDGRRIAFTSHRDGNAEVYIMQADGSAPVRVTNSPERDDYPDWHPDGRRLVFVGERQGQFDLYLTTLPD